jgi:endonuclease YncB( thermonuclease family)
MTVWSFDNATVNRVIDGDTVSVIVDIGFGVTYTSNFRLLGCNARELSMPGGKEARANLAQLLPAGTPVSLHSVKNDKYGGRFDAVIYLAGVNITTTLINTGWAAAWDGVGTAPVPAWPR